MKWNFAEMHCHTRHSDGSFTPAALAEAARDHMLDGIALTDHNTASGVKELAETGLPFIPGIEWTTFYGHMLVLGAKKYIDWRDALPDTIDEKMAAVHAAGGLCGIAHPFDLGSPMCTGCYWDFNVHDYHNVDYIEVWHGEFPPTQWKVERAMKMWTDALDNGCRVAPMYGRDWHGPEIEAEPSGVTMLGMEGAFTAESGFEAVKRGRVMLTLGFGAYMTLEAEGGGTYDIGDTVPTGSYTCRVRVDMTQRERVWKRYGITAGEAVLYGKGGRILACSPVVNDSCIINTDLTADDMYVRLEIRGHAMNKACTVALSAPVYIGDASC